MMMCVSRMMGMVHGVHFHVLLLEQKVHLHLLLLLLMSGCALIRHAGV